MSVDQNQRQAPSVTVVLGYLLVLCFLLTPHPAAANPVTADWSHAMTADPNSVPRGHDQPPREMVFLLHGIAKGKFDMAALARRLRQEGYVVVNWEYPSTQHTICELADQLAEQVQRFPDYKINFVTHSMGGIVVRTFFTQHPELINAGRLVMIAPPNQGAELAQTLGGWGIYQYILGPAGQELKPGDAGSCAGAGIPPVEFGIIAGGTGTRLGINPLLAGDNDGTVTVESTRLDGAQDFTVVPYPHPVIQMMPRTADLAITFLRQGKF